jgi:hypothetical protein
MARDHHDDGSPAARLDTWPLDDDGARPSPGAAFAAPRLPGTEFELQIGSDAELELDLPPPAAPAVAPVEPVPLSLELPPSTPAPRHAHSARAPLPRPGARGPGWLLIAGGALVVVAVVAIIGLVDWNTPPPPVAAPEPATAPPTTRAVDDLLFAGRDPGWWQRRLQGLAAAPEGEALYRLTEQRARALGLQVARDANGVRVEVSPALLQALAGERTP